MVRIGSHTYDVVDLHGPHDEGVLALRGFLILLVKSYQLHLQCLATELDNIAINNLLPSTGLVRR